MGWASVSRGGSHQVKKFKGMHPNIFSGCIGAVEWTGTSVNGFACTTSASGLLSSSAGAADEAGSLPIRFMGLRLDRSGIENMDELVLPASFVVGGFAGSLLPRMLGILNMVRAAAQW